MSTASTGAILRLAMHGARRRRLIHADRGDAPWLEVRLGTAESTSSLVPHEVAYDVRQERAGKACGARRIGTTSSKRMNVGHRADAVAHVLTLHQVERTFALGAAVGRVGLEPTADGL